MPKAQHAQGAEGEKGHKEQGIGETGTRKGKEMGREGRSRDHEQGHPVIQVLGLEGHKRLDGKKLAHEDIEEHSGLDAVTVTGGEVMHHAYPSPQGDDCPGGPLLKGEGLVGFAADRIVQGEGLRPPEEEGEVPAHHGIACHYDKWHGKTQEHSPQAAQGNAA